MGKRIIDMLRTAALLAVGLSAAGVSFSTQARAEACSLSCDAACAVCCKSWSLQAACAGGGAAVGTEGQYGSFVEAKAAADVANKMAKECAGGDCSRIRKTCTDGSVANWAVSCAPELTMPPAAGSGITKQLDPVVASCDQQLAALGEAQAAVFKIAVDRVLSASGQKAVAFVASNLRGAKERLAATRDEARRLRDSAQTKDADVQAFNARSAAAMPDAAAAVVEAKTFAADAAMIDMTAETRAKRVAAEEAAAKARVEDAARRRTEAQEAARADALRRAAEAVAAAAARKEQAEAAARTRADAAAMAASANASRLALASQSQAEAQTRADADLAKRVQQNHEALVRTLGENAKMAAEGGAAIAAFLALPNVMPRARTEGTALQQKLLALEGRANAGVEKANAAKGQQPTQKALDGVTQVRNDTSNVGSETRLAFVSAKTLVSAPANVSKTPLVAAVEASSVAANGRTAIPTCEIMLEPEGGAVGITVAVDGAKPVQLPSKIHVGSGQHVLLVQQGATVSERRELLVCNRLSTLRVAPPK